MNKFIIILIAGFLNINSHGINNDKNNFEIRGLYHAFSPKNAEGNYYFFEEDKLHIFWRYDKTTTVNEYAAKFDYYIKDDKIFACNNALICDDKNNRELFELRYEIISIEMVRDEQIVKLKAKHFDSPLILERID